MTRTRKVTILAITAASTVAAVSWRRSHRVDLNQSVIRVGWATTWATQGQLVQALQSDSILSRNNVRAKFTGFASGPAELEVANAGRLDVVSAAAQPILQLVAQNNNWVIVSRNAYVRVAILVPIPSTARSFQDVLGKKIALQVGTTAETFIMELASQKDLDLRVGREIVDMDINAQAEFARRSSNSWGDIGAIVTWEPTASLLESAGYAKVLQSKDDLTLTAMSRALIREHPEVAEAYLRATLEAWAYYANNHAAMNEKYIQAAHLSIPSTVLERVADDEPNAKATSVRDVDISLGIDKLKTITALLKLLVSQGRLATAPPTNSMVDQGLLGKASAGVDQ